MESNFVFYNPICNSANFQEQDILGQNAKIVGNWFAFEIKPCLKSKTLRPKTANSWEMACFFKSKPIFQ